MGELVSVLLAIDKTHRVPQRALACIPDLGGLNQVYGSMLGVSVASIASMQYNGRETLCCRLTDQLVPHNKTNVFVA